MPGYNREALTGDFFIGLTQRYASTVALGLGNSHHHTSVFKCYKIFISFLAGILVFYTIFFSALAAMFAICMYGLLATLSPEFPTYQLDSSIIGSNPGLGYRPYADGEGKEASSLVWYMASNQTNIKQWTSSLDNFLAGMLVKYLTYYFITPKIFF